MYKIYIDLEEHKIIMLVCVCPRFIHLLGNLRTRIASAQMPIYIAHMELIETCKYFNAPLDILPKQGYTNIY